MKKLFLLFILTFGIVQISNSQWKLNEGFESDTTLPVGWSVVNDALFPIDPTTNWTVRDSGSAIPGLSTATAKAHSGRRSIQVSWWTSVDTTGGPSSVSDAWLITKKITNIGQNDKLIFWATGGTASYSDSLQIWVGTDSIPFTFPDRVLSIFWPVGSTYGQYTRYEVSLALYQGLDIFIGFRYNMDCAVNGFAVQLDDIQVGDPTNISQIGSNVPTSFALNQNYPNPFNPKTKIRFDIAKATNVNLVVYNSLGQVVKELVNGMKSAGTYEAEFDASSLASGTYFYRLTTDDFTETKKMLLVK
ncbi:MAG: T9SS type A sorting domain-containing protein [Ignavibacteria bacterium]|nr:T9SS type A sorting domain-containing protein [Ignavibacteria bacterium]